MATFNHSRQNSVEETDEKISIQASQGTFPQLYEPDTEQYEKEDEFSPAAQRADLTQLNDDLELLRAERLISNQEHDARKSLTHNRSHNPDPDDAFNQQTQNVKLEKKKNEKAALYKLWRFLKKFPRLIRYFVYMIPGAALVLIPVLLGVFRYDDDSKNIGGVYLLWFGIWLEILWCSLWVSRMISSLLPHIFYGSAKLAGSANPSKWKDTGSELDLHFAMFLWLLANIISFKPTTYGHRVPQFQDTNPQWIDILQKVIIALFVLATLNFVEKIILQWIARSFHQRTYATRIENNKGDIKQLIQLFEYAKVKLEHSDAFWQGNPERASGTQTPMRALHQNAQKVIGKVGWVANRVGNDLIGRKVDNNNLPRKVVTELLKTTASAHTLARLIYRSLKHEGGRDTIHPEDMKEVFSTDEEVEAAFGVFDKDMNGDISIDEFEAACNEIHLEKKAIAASLKDLDSVIQKLDKVFLFIIVVIAIIVFISILSGSAAAGLASASTSVLGLAWMLQATAQEFLQSIIFVFVKHPFDVGDRVTIYGSTGATLTGDDYLVVTVSLLYTEFRKMQGQVVQAPNSVLNTLFILNQRRSNGLADVVPLEMRFGTTTEQIEELKNRMLDFVLQHKRDYQPNILTEMTAIDAVRACNMNMVFFHKTSFQNELLRLNRHNRFVTELMQQMIQVGIQAPVRIEPGGSREYPMYWSNLAPPPTYEKEQQQNSEDSVPPLTSLHRTATTHSSMRTDRMNSISNDNVLNSFQDFSDSRRETAIAHRMASIREKEMAEERHITSEDEPRASSTSAALRPTASIESHSRSRVFTRPRSKTKSSRRDADMV